ncbi:MAG: PKD domain-containing protein, partial [Thermoplasmata archaeon]
INDAKYWGAMGDYKPMPDNFDGDTLYIGTRWVLDPPGTPGTGYPNYSFQGSIDEIVLFNRALSHQEVLDYYNSGKEYPLDRYDIPAQIVSYEWDFESDGIYDYQETTGNAPDGTFDGKTNHTYGDDGVYNVTLRVTDDEGLSGTDICNITVVNVDPTVTIESAIMDVEIGLRVAGRKWNDVGMTLFEDGVSIGYVSIERLPGSPDDQMAWIPTQLDMTKTYSATVTFIPEDPPKVGANPVWIYIKFENGEEEKIHHTFNVQQSKKRDSDHWNHVEPWEVGLNVHLEGHEFEITSHITDQGSDDETLTYTYGTQTVTVTYLNSPPNPDLYPSPEVNPRDITDTTTLIYDGPGTVTLVVKDDDNIRLGVGQGTDSINIA